MKINPGFILQSVGNQNFIIPVGQKALEFQGLVKINATGKLLFEALQNEQTLADLIKIFTTKYTIDQATATRDVESFLAILRSKKII